ncbi:MAG: UrcA family protein [Halioglobus sp.]
MKNLAITSALSAAAFSLVVGFSANVAAESFDETFVHAPGLGTKSITVQYHAADLATEEGVLELHSQIKIAAKHLCGSTSLHKAGSLSAATRNRQCSQEAMDVAISQVGSSQLAALSQ